jgi:hypothetical protein
MRFTTRIRLFSDSVYAFVTPCSKWLRISTFQFFQAVVSGRNASLVAGVICAAHSS